MADRANKSFNRACLPSKLFHMGRVAAGGLYALGLSQEDGHLCAVDQIHAYMLHLHAGNLLPPPHPSSPQTPPFFLLHFIFV